jgi:hypothetical protein
MRILARRLKWPVTAALAVLLFSSCVPIGGVWSDSTEEDFFLRGTSRFFTPAGETLPSAEQVIASDVLDNLSLYSGLAYRVSYKQDYTRLASGSVWAIHQDFSSDPLYYYGYAAGGPADGTLNVGELQCEVIVTLPEPPAGYAGVTLSGTFDREQAQRSIDRLRKSEERYGYAAGHERFIMHWTVSGTLYNQPFSMSVDQECAAGRVRYSTPI